MGLNGLQYKEVDSRAGDPARRAQTQAGLKGPGRSCVNKQPPVFAEKWSLN